MATTESPTLNGDEIGQVLDDPAVSDLGLGVRPLENVRGAGGSASDADEVPEIAAFFAKGALDRDGDFPSALPRLFAIV